MEKLVLLQIQTTKELISIPFENLELLDLFTVRYKSHKDLVLALNKLLNLRIDVDDRVDVYVSYEYISRKNLYKSKNDCVKLSSDNFDKNYIGEALIEYLKADQSRIKKTPIKDIKTKAMYEFNMGIRFLSTFEIEDAVRKYLTNAPYRTFRKMYFLIKDFTNVRKKYINFCDCFETDRALDKYSSEDDYLDYILQYGLRGEAEYEQAMEMLSRVDLEELSEKIKGMYFGIFDGMSEDSSYATDAADLERCTGLSIEEMRAYLFYKRKLRQRK